MEVVINGETWIVRKPTLRDIFQMQKMNAEDISPEESLQVMTSILQKTILKTPNGYSLEQIEDLPADIALELFSQIMGSTIEAAKKLQGL
jgi:hypothetical protein